MYLECLLSLFMWMLLFSYCLCLVKMFNKPTAGAWKNFRSGARSARSKRPKKQQDEGVEGFKQIALYRSECIH